MKLSHAFKLIFMGYAFLFVEVRIFIDLLPDALGYWMIARGWTEICDSGLTGFSETRQARVHQASLLLMIVSIGEELWQILGGGDAGTGGAGLGAGLSMFHSYVPETPPLFEISWTILPKLAIFLLGIWLMANILTASGNIAEGEGKRQVGRAVDRCLRLMKRIYVPIAMDLILMAQCVNLPDTVWGNLIRGVQELGSLIYLCFQLMLVLQIANMRKNLDCCRETDESAVQ